MARGGSRPGAGRPKGSFKSMRIAEPEPLADDGGMMPLDFMLAVIRDPSVDPAIRARMAIAAAPFCHPRVADDRISKRDRTEEASKMAAEGNEWGNVIKLAKPS